MIWGLTPTINKVLSEYHAPFIVTFFRFFFAAFIFAILFKYSKRTLFFQRSSISLFFWLGFFGFVMHNALMCKGLEGTSAGLASIIMSLIVVQVVLIDWLIFKRAPSLNVALGIILSITGVYFVSADGLVHTGEGSHINELLVFLSALSWAVYTVICRNALKKYDELTLLACATFFAVLFLLPIPIFHHETVIKIILNPASLLLLVFTGLISSALTFFWHQQAIRKIGVLTTSIFLNLVPVFGVLSAHLILQEEISLRMLMGASVTVIGIIIVSFFYQPNGES